MAKSLDIIENILQLLQTHEKALERIFETKITDRTIFDNRTRELEPSQIIHYIILESNCLTMANNQQSGIFKCHVSFDGEYDSNFESFIKQFEMFLLSKSIDKTKNSQLAYATLSLSLTDSAKIFFESIPETELSNEITVPTSGGIAQYTIRKFDYQKLVDKLRTRFIDTRSQGDKMITFLKVKQQRNENIGSYLKRFIKCSADISLSTDSEAAESQKMVLFVNGLLPKLKLELQKNICFYKNFQELEAQARRLESIFGSNASGMSDANTDDEILVINSEKRSHKKYKKKYV